MSKDTKNFDLATEKRSLNAIKSEESYQPINPKDYQIDLTDEIPDPEPIFVVSGKLLCSPGNILIIKAKPKAAKSFTVSILIASYFTGRCLNFGSFRLKKVAWIDSEQSLNQLHKNSRRTHRMAGFKEGENHPDLHIYYAREMEVKARWELLETICKDPEISIVFFDVGTDLVDDINDAVETKKIADRLLSIAGEYNILIICTIHENKQDRNATGHFGGSLQKKSEAVISLTKANGVFTIEATDTRHGDWPEFSFIINSEGIPEGVDSISKPTPTEVKEAAIRRNMETILKLQRLTYTELSKQYTLQEVCSLPTAKRHIKTALEREYIKVQQDNRYTLCQHQTE